MNTFHIARHSKTNNNKERRLSGWINTPLTEAGLVPISHQITKSADVHIADSGHMTLESTVNSATSGDSRIDHTKR